MWYDEGEMMEMDGKPVWTVRAEKVPGQRRITSYMTAAEKLAYAEENEQIRRREVKKAEETMKNKILLMGKFLNLGIPTGGYYNKDNEKHREDIMNIGGAPIARAPIPKPAETRPTARPPVAEPRHFAWIHIYYKGYNFRIIIHNKPLDTQGDWTAEGKLFVKTMPTDKEEVYLQGESENTIWSQINLEFPRLSYEKKMIYIK